MLSPDFPGAIRAIALFILAVFLILGLA